MDNPVGKRGLAYRCVTRRSKNAYQGEIRRWHDIQAPMGPRPWRQETNDLHRHPNARTRNLFSRIRPDRTLSSWTGKLSEAAFDTTSCSETRYEQSDSPSLLGLRGWHKNWFSTEFVAMRVNASFKSHSCNTLLLTVSS